MSYKALAIIFFNGVFFHIILTGPLMLFINGNIGSAALVGAQLANAVLFLLIPWAGEKCAAARLSDRSHDGAIRGRYSGEGRKALAAGAPTHVLLFSGYGFFQNGVIGNTGLLVYAA